MDFQSKQRNHIRLEYSFRFLSWKYLVFEFKMFAIGVLLFGLERTTLRNNIRLRIINVSRINGRTEKSKIIPSFVMNKLLSHFVFYSSLTSNIIPKEKAISWTKWKIHWNVISNQCRRKFIRILGQNVFNNRYLHIIWICMKKKHLKWEMFASNQKQLSNLLYKTIACMCLEKKIIDQKFKTEWITLDMRLT